MSETEATKELRATVSADTYSYIKAASERLGWTLGRYITAIHEHQVVNATDLEIVKIDFELRDEAFCE